MDPGEIGGNGNITWWISQIRLQIHKDGEEEPKNKLFTCYWALNNDVEYKYTVKM